MLSQATSGADLAVSYRVEPVLVLADLAKRCPVTPRCGLGPGPVSGRVVEPEQDLSLRVGGKELVEVCSSGRRVCPKRQYGLFQHFR